MAPVHVGPDSQLGRYVVDARIGSGGMGEVWRARDPRIGRTVAIKVLPAELRADAERLQRFEQEARAVGALSHPNLLVLFDVGQHDGSPYLVTELLDGESLRSRLRGGPLSARTALRIAADVARGLAAAHGTGIVHRDVKPDNLFITADGRVKILDFGVAKLRRDLDQDDTATITSSPETQAGAVIGTPGYMAPEQLTSREIDARTDLFALGVVLHEMLTGERPFAADHAAEEQAQILRGAPAPVIGVSAAIESVVLRCLEKRPEARFQSASDLAFALDALVATDTPSDRRSGANEALPPTATAAPARRRGPIAALVAATVAGATAATIVSGLVRARDPDPPSWPSLPGGGAVWRRITYRAGASWPGRFSPDGRSVLFSETRDHFLQAHIIRTELAAPTRQDLGLVGKLAGVSADGELALITEGADHRPTLVRGFPGAGGPRVVTPAVDAGWGPSNELIVVRRDDAGWTIEYPLGTPVVHHADGVYAYPRVSPDDKLIAFAEKPSPSETRGHVVIVDRTGAPVARSPEHDGVVGIVWAPGGREIWFSTWTSNAADNGLFALDLAGHERLLFHNAGVFTLEDLARDGRLLMRRIEDRTRLFVMDRGQPARDATWFDNTDVQGISAARDLIAFAESGGTGQTREGYATYVARGSDPPALATHAYVSALVPDGSALIRITGDADPLSRVSLGAGTSKMLPRGAVKRVDIADPLQVSLDGRWLVFRGAVADGPMRLWLQDLDGGEPRPIGPPTVRAGHHPISPDGAWVAIAAAAGGVQLISTTGAADRTLAGALRDTPIAFSADRASLFVLNLAAPGHPIDRVDLASGAHTPWMQLPVPSDAWPDYIRIAIDPSGETVAFSTLTQQADLFVVEPPR